MNSAEPEDGVEFNPRKFISSQFTFLGIEIAMVVVGALYSESCTVEIVPKFLQIGGGVMLGFSSLYLVCSVCCCGEDDGISNITGAFVIW